jgi:hypothetical protein
MVVLGGEAVSYERGTPALHRVGWAPDPRVHPGDCLILACILVTALRAHWLRTRPDIQLFWSKPAFAPGRGQGQLYTGTKLGVPNTLHSSTSKTSWYKKTFKPRIYDLFEYLLDSAGESVAEVGLGCGPAADGRGVHLVQFHLLLPGLGISYEKRNE